MEDMLISCLTDFKGNWDDHSPLIEFVYNNSYHSSIQMTLFEALYGRTYRSSIGWFEVGEVALIGLESVHEAMEKVRLIRDRLGIAQKLAPLHLVFHVSLLKKNSNDPTSVLPLESVYVKKILSYEEVPVDILDHQVRRLRNKEVTSVKVLWRNQLVERATWEAEANMIA
ncbi:uncharacterized protein LOC129883448 [Solanum dulcamara]|uniref:uncharacterized protein LOC129883448 n=1 Tax=Solanum dulcamara TaxID=45834 RepID=UPI00248537E1|nr:uncharacterized protein LOC129883448 [Solanum dulcamara]